MSEHPEQRSMIDRLGEGHRLINADYPAGCWGWVKVSRPDLTLAVEDSARSIDTAILANDATAFQRALRTYSKRWRAVFAAYRDSQA
ncbi:hypothetical protein BMS3Abin14_00738 [bacterium BMS3Abin14]|nr:hypothetical protein BMS3Abin14_00738 [bacterium BMS3Abin14]